MRKTTELAYRTAAVDSGNPIGLYLALYDTLSGNLRRAIEALRRNDIQLRCAELNHALTVLAHLENWIDGDLTGSDRADGTQPKALADSLTAFYAYLRAKMLEASIKKSPEMLEALVELVLQVRTAWQEREALSQQSKLVPSAFTGDLPAATPIRAAHVPLSQSA